jgi:hypothetical protein
MPKTSMNENGLTPCWKRQIGLAGQILAMQAESITHAMCEFPNKKLRRGIAALDRAHNSAASWRGSLHRLLRKTGNFLAT